MSKKLSLVVPVYNEEKTLEILVQKVLTVSFPQNISKEIILVNDGSKDKSGEIMDQLAEKFSEIKSYHNKKNSGKTQTVKNGISYTTGDYVVIQDADLEYEPNELVDLLNLMLEKDLDVVYGNRFGKKNKVVYWQNYIGNKALSFFSNIFTYPRIKVYIPDMEVCYKMIRGNVAREIGSTIKSTSKFGLEPEITAKLSRYKLNSKHLKFGVVPISYYPRTIAEGKKMSAFSDGLKALKEIIQYNL
ncbi:putative glycosyltransferase [Patescibacteria group bacterium]|nr:putative glycosyltransferase [Patescibacteria group bacterium]